MSAPIRADLDFGSIARLLNLPDAVDPQEPATKAQLDAAVEGLAWKDNVRAASTANITVSNPGTDTFDGVTLVAGDRILLKDQTSAPENGIYVFNGSGVAMARAADASTFAELENAVVSVDEGSANGQTSWKQGAVNGTIDTDDVTWGAFGSDVPDATETVKGKVELATQAEVDAGSGTALVVTADKLAAWSSRPQRHAENVGDGSNTSFTITHNFATRDLVVMVRENAGNYREAMVEKRINNDNAIDLVFASAPTTNQYRVIILA